jgi:hypothetical protein
MASRKTSALTALTAPASDDVLPIIDVSEALAENQNKKITVANLIKPLFYYRLDSAVAGANVTTAQSIFGVGVTLAASTVYEIEGVFAISKSAGTTSHTVSLLFGGTATLNNIGYLAQSANASAFTGQTAALTTHNYIAAGTATVITAAITDAARAITVRISGTVSVNAGGTFIPQYQLSAAPGGAYTTAIGSYITFNAIGTSGSNSSNGTWA